MALSRPDATTDPLPGQLRATHAAMARAWGPCIGTICLSGLIQAFLGSILFFLRGLRRVSSVSRPFYLSPDFRVPQVTSLAILPAFLHPLSIPIVLLSHSLTPYTFSGYTLPYAGLTGEAFFSSSRRAREITSIKRTHVAPPTCTLCICVV